MVRRLVEEQQVRRLDPEQREFQPGPLAARQRPYLLVRVVAAEQEPREVRARLALRHRHTPRVSASRTVVPGDAPPPQLGQVARAGRPCPKVSDPSSAGRSPGDRAQERRLAGTVRPDDADALASLRGEQRRPGHDASVVAADPSGAIAPRPGNTRRPAPRRGRRSRRSATDRCRPAPPAGSRQLAAAPSAPPGAPPAACSRRASCSCIFANLRWLRYRWIELPLASDLLRPGRRVLDRPLVPFDALAMVRAVVASERRQPPIAQFPDPLDGRVQERAVVRGDQQRRRRAAEGAPRATRGRRGRGGSSARRASAGRGRR